MIKALLGLAVPIPMMKEATAELSAGSPTVTLFLCGDVMIGRGIDQVLPHPSDPRIYEPYMRSARGYVELAEESSGPIPKPVSYDYIWGDALEELDRVAPDVRIINLETAVTRSDDYAKGKGINYRMHPDNVPCITAAKIDCCVLANNHVLDWGPSGLTETLDSLRRVGLKIAGAGRNREEAKAPAVLEVVGKGRVIVFSFGSITSGIPWYWAASDEGYGVNLLTDLSSDTVREITKVVQGVKRAGDIVVASTHWGGNWGYRIPSEQRRFACQLIDEAGVDLIHGHSSHHPKGIEVYRDRPVLYGCGDFLNDYEGIGGYHEFRGDLALMYFVTMDLSTGSLVEFEMVPMKIQRFRLERAPRADAEWLRATLNREGRQFGTRVELNEDSNFELAWR